MRLDWALWRCDSMEPSVSAVSLACAVLTFSCALTMFASAVACCASACSRSTAMPVLLI